MNKNNKKGETMYNLWLFVMLFAFVTFIFLISSLYTYEVGKDYIIEPIHNASMVTAEQAGLSEQMKDSIDADKQAYEDIEVPYDLYFIGLLLTGLIITFTASFFSRQESIISFYGYLTFGMMIFLAAVAIANTILNWLLDNLIYGMFGDAIYSAPLLFSFLDNLGLWCFVWALGLLLINQLDIGKNKTEELQ